MDSFKDFLTDVVLRMPYHLGMNGYPAIPTSVHELNPTLVAVLSALHDRIQSLQSRCEVLERGREDLP